MLEGAMADPILLGVNIDHVATLRQARHTAYPSVLAAAQAAECGGADGITVHLREDRRHIQDADVELLRRRVATKLNLEMAASEEMVAKACALRPRDVCLVPERRAELTTEGGLDAAGQIEALGGVLHRLRGVGIRVSLFIDPEDRQVQAARELRADAIEIHTGRYADATDVDVREAELERIRAAAHHAHQAGLIVNAGHGLTLENVAAIAALPQVHELNIGHSIVCRAIFVGLEAAVREMKARMLGARRV
jgi:pyridoxine 5-phosphate synthase